MLKKVFKQDKCCLFEFQHRNLALGINQYKTLSNKKRKQVQPPKYAFYQKLQKTGLAAYSTTNY
jgi:hypothetical protein